MIHLQWFILTKEQVGSKDKQRQIVSSPSAAVCMLILTLFLTVVEHLWLRQNVRGKGCPREGQGLVGITGPAAFTLPVDQVNIIMLWFTVGSMKIYSHHPDSYPVSRGAVLTMLCKIFAGETCLLNVNVKPFLTWDWVGVWLSSAHSLTIWITCYWLKVHDLPLSYVSVDFGITLTEKGLNISFSRVSYDDNTLRVSLEPTLAGNDMPTLEIHHAREGLGFFDGGC